jgi:hypothetical protein
VSGEVLVCRNFWRPFKRSGWATEVLEDSDGTVLAEARSSGTGMKIALDDGSRYMRKTGSWRNWLKVVNLRNGEPVLETRFGHRFAEPIKFRGHDLSYSMARAEMPNVSSLRTAYAWELASRDGLRIADGDTLVLSYAAVRGAGGFVRSAMQCAVVGDDTLGPDMPLIALVGFSLFGVGQQP